MKLIIDSREHKLISYISTENLSIETQNLELGDAQLIDTCDNIVIIFERKSISDLLSSIKDGRYNEQSIRLTNSYVHNHNIYYIIEGFIPKQNEPLLHSTIFSLSFYKGYSVLRTNNVKDTANMITHFVKKLEKNIKLNKNPYYSLSENVPNDKETSDYCSTIKSCKKDNITPDNILYIILKQIPMVSDKSASVLHSEYKTLNVLLNTIKNSPDNLFNIKITNEKTGKSRRISKTAINNIINYLAP